MLLQKYLENGIIDLDILDQQSTQPVKQATQTNICQSQYNIQEPK